MIPTRCPLATIFAWGFALAFTLASPSLARAAPEAPLSPTPRKTVSDTYHKVPVKDDYRWLENYGDPEVRKWSDEQNRHTQAVLDRLPQRAAIKRRVQELELSTSPGYGELFHRGGKLFALKIQPPRQQPFVVTMKSADEPATERVIVDPNTLSDKGTTAIDFYVPSLDGRLVAVSLSDKGSENGTVHVFDVATGKEVGDTIPHVNGGTAGGSLDWNADGTGFYYTRYPQAGERPKEDLDFYQQVYFHKLGDQPGKDRYAIGKDFPRIAEIVLHTRDDGKYVLCSVANGDGGEFAHYVLPPQGQWIQVTHFSDHVVGAAFGSDESLYLLSRSGASRGKVLRLPLGGPDLKKAQTVVPPSEAVIVQVVPTKEHLYVVDLLGGPAQIRAFDPVGQKEKRVPLGPIASVGQVLRLPGDAILFSSQTFITPSAWYRFAPGDEKTRRTALYRTSLADFSDSEVVREYATSKDGTQVPLNIIRRKGTILDHKNPTILYGYGGYSVSQTPTFSTSRRVWVEQGGIYVVANLRGGGEYGEEWHHAGNLTRKQNVFDDFAACARYLIDKGYTSRDKLAIWGGSNGGLLMGASVVQHPELYRAVVTKAGIYDMLRVELSPNGAFNVTEFGTVKDPEQFKALYGYSPYHHVADGTPYPAVFFLTGDHDPRVDPANSRKMAARLQAATTSRNPILLRTSSISGHGIGTALSERIAETADAYTFVFSELGVLYKPVPESKPEMKKQASIP